MAAEYIRGTLPSRTSLSTACEGLFRVVGFRDGVLVIRSALLAVLEDSQSVSPPGKKLSNH